MEFARRFYGNSVGAIKECWHAQRDHPGYPDLPIHDHEFNFEEKAIPLFIHGDDVGAIGIGKVWSKAVDCVSFGSIIGGRGGAFDTHIIIWLLFNNILTKSTDAARTLQVLWRHLVWSLYWLGKGRWPDRDPNGDLYLTGPAADRAGKPLADGFFGQLWNARADGDWVRDQYHLADDTGSVPCTCCPAGAEPMPWTDCRTEEEGNTWIGAIWTKATFAARFGDHRHRLFRFSLASAFLILSQTCSTSSGWAQPNT